MLIGGSVAIAVKEIAASVPSIVQTKSPDL